LSRGQEGPVAVATGGAASGGPGSGRDPRPSSFPGGKWQILVSSLSPKFSFHANYDGWIEDSVNWQPHVNYL
jgi:hypothetical protein